MYAINSCIVLKTLKVLPQLSTNKSKNPTTRNNNITVIQKVMSLSGLY